jgi:hypothetical protein
MTPVLRRLVSADSAAAWRRAGFYVEETSQEVRVGRVVIEVGAGVPETRDSWRQTQSVPPVRVPPQSESHRAEGGLVGWGWSALPVGTSEVAGIHAFITEENSETPPIHPNRVSGIDHVVLRTTNVENTKSQLARVGLEPRRERKDLYPGVTQVFYRPQEDIIIEMVGPTEVPEADEDDPSGTFLWGVTFVSDDLGATKAHLKDELGEIRDARQGGGRRIATLRHKAVGLRSAVAIMTPHVRAPNARL